MIPMEGQEEKVNLAVSSGIGSEVVVGGSGGDEERVVDELVASEVRAESSERVEVSLNGVLREESGSGYGNDDIIKGTGFTFEGSELGARKECEVPRPLGEESGSGNGNDEIKGLGSAVEGCDLGAGKECEVPNHLGEESGSGNGNDEIMGLGSAVEGCDLGAGKECEVPKHLGEESGSGNGNDEIKGLGSAIEGCDLGVGKECEVPKRLGEESWPGNGNDDIKGTGSAVEGSDLGDGKECEVLRPLVAVAETGANRELVDGGMKTGENVGGGDDVAETLREVGVEKTEANVVGIAGAPEGSMDERFAGREAGVAEELEIAVEEGRLEAEEHSAGDDAMDDVNSGDVRVVVNESQCHSFENEVGGSSVIVGSSEEVVISVGKGRLEAGDTKEGARSAGDDVNSGDVRAPGNESQSHGDENQLGGSSVIVGPSEGEIPSTVPEKTDLDVETDAVEGSGTQMVDALPGAANNAETGFSSGTSSDEKLANMEIMVEAGDVATASNQVPDTVVGVLGSDVLRAEPEDALKGTTSSSEVDLALAEKDDNSSAISQCLDEHVQAAAVSNVASLDDDVTCHNIEGMDTDLYNEKFYFSVEELQGSIETVNRNTENQINALADQQLSYQTDQVDFEGEVAFSEKDTLENSENNRENDFEKNLDENATDKDTDDKQATVGDELEADAVCEQMEVEAINGSIISSGGASPNLASACQSAHAVAKDKVSVGDVGLKTYVRTSQKSDFNALNNANTEGADVQLEVNDKNAAKSSARVESDSSLLPEFQEQGVYSEQDFMEDDQAKQNLGVETMHRSTETDVKFMDVADTRKGSYEEAAEEDFNRSADEDIPEIDSSAGHGMRVEEHASEDEDSHEGPELEVEEQDSDSEQPRTSEEKSARRATMNRGSSVQVNQASYHLQPDDKGSFCVSDLVWGKVRSHPWWPGQIFEASDASERAMKYHKKDSFLVAYFGDRTFAWNEASVLKPFRSHFSQVEKQSNSESFQNAVTCALDEVSRRVELGLSCSCILSDVHDRLKFQQVENTGIRQESSTRGGVDKSLGVDFFQPNNLVDYIKALAQSPSGGADRLDLTIATSQLLSFYRLKHYYQLPELEFWENEDGLECEDEATVDASFIDMKDCQIRSGPEIAPTQRSSYHKRKHNLKDGFYPPRKKEKCMSELMGEWDAVDGEMDLQSPSSRKKRKGSEFFADDFQEGRKTISLAKVSTTTPKPSFKIGECIRRVASQMTGSPSILKSNNQKLDGSSDGLVGDVSDGSLPHSEDADMKTMVVPTEYSSLNELLGQLFFAAQDPFSTYGYLNSVISFFSDFRNSVIIEPDDKDGKRKALFLTGCSPETFEFDDMSDTYWTDMVIQNGSEVQQPRKRRKRENQLVPVDAEKPLRRPYSRKRYSVASSDQPAVKPVGYIDENTPAELVMHFPAVDSVPSETNLNKMFRCFGPLKESDTEVDRDTNRARVVFKRCSDAEAAYGSAPKFNIFGQTLVNYQLNYTITVPFKATPIAMMQGEEDAALFLEY